MCASNGRKYLCLCVWSIFKAKPLANAAAIGTLSSTVRMDGLPQCMEAVSGQEHGHLCPVIECIDTRAVRFYPHRINVGIRSAPPSQIVEGLAGSGALATQCDRVPLVLTTDSR
jgi:hypothetical protein